MKKLFLLLAVALPCLFLTVPSYAIEDPDPAGTIIVGVQVGPRIGYSFGQTDVDIDEWFNINYETTGGGIMLGVAPMLTADYVLVDSWWKGHFTIGLQTGAYWMSTLKGPKEDRFKRSVLFVAPRAMYGLNLSKQFEVHAGLATGIGFDWLGYEKKVYSGPSFSFGYIMGGRFNITEQFSVTADINLSNHMPALGIGLAYKF